MVLTPGRAMLLSTVGHAEFLNWMIRLMHRNSWRVHVDHDSRKEHWGADSGWPDVFGVRGNRAIAAELKVGADRLKPEQRIWQEVLSQVVGIECYVWKPSDEKEIEEVLV